MNATIRQILERGLGDERVRSISWANDDLLVDLALPSRPERNLCLRFVAIARLRIDLDYGEYVGLPLLFSAEAHELEPGRWKILFEFGAAPDGKIEFECEGISESERI